MITVTATNLYFLNSPTIKDFTLTTYLNVTIQKCFPTCIYIPNILSAPPHLPDLSPPGLTFLEDLTISLLLIKEPP